MNINKNQLIKTWNDSKNYPRKKKKKVRKLILKTYKL
jgi:hypothetical protein